MLARLPCLPFAVSFDILFSHGGMDAFIAAHRRTGPRRLDARRITEGGEAEALYQFWRIYFVSTPMGKVYPRSIGLWVDAMSTLHIVRSLRHPSDAIFLLRPEHRAVPESVAAWAVAAACGFQTFPPVEVIVLAMKVLLPRPKPGDAPILLRAEWLWLHDLLVRRTRDEWLQFADEAIASHIFTDAWWRCVALPPCEGTGGGGVDGAHPVAAGTTMTMGGAMAALARRERETLKDTLRKAETARLLETLAREREKREWRKQLKEAAPEAMGTKKKGKGGGGTQETRAPLPSRRGEDPEAGGGKPRGAGGKAAAATAKGSTGKVAAAAAAPSLTPAQKEEVVRLARLRYKEHVSAVQRAKDALRSMSTVALDKNFSPVSRLVAALSAQYPLVRWNIRLAFHGVLFHTGRSNWDIERELFRWQRDKTIADPLAKLERLRSSSSSPSSLRRKEGVR